MNSISAACSTALLGINELKNCGDLATVATVSNITEPAAIIQNALKALPQICSDSCKTGFVKIADVLKTPACQDIANGTDTLGLTTADIAPLVPDIYSLICLKDKSTSKFCLETQLTSLLPFLNNPAGAVGLLSDQKFTCTDCAKQEVAVVKGAIAKLPKAVGDQATPIIAGLDESQKKCPAPSPTPNNGAYRVDGLMALLVAGAVFLF